MRVSCSSCVRGGVPVRSKSCSLRAFRDLTSVIWFGGCLHERRLLSTSGVPLNNQQRQNLLASCRPHGTGCLSTRKSEPSQSSRFRTRHRTSLRRASCREEPRDPAAPRNRVESSRFPQIASACTSRRMVNFARCSSACVGSHPVGYHEACRGIGCPAAI